MIAQKVLKNESVYTEIVLSSEALFVYGLIIYMDSKIVTASMKISILIHGESQRLVVGF